MDNRNRRNLSNNSVSFEYSDSSDEDETLNYVLYRNRPEWKDVHPIPEDDGGTKVGPIAYSEKFLDVFDYFRGVLNTGEKSERTLDLVDNALNLNPANYTVWNYRLEIVLFLKVDLHDELIYISNMIRKFTKTYQVWHYRIQIVKMLKNPSAELKFTADILHMNVNNYHAWRYRRWVLRKFSHLMEKEMEFVEHLLSQNIMNNSAWNHRYFVINNLSYNSDQIEKELQYTFSKIITWSRNESAWNYIKKLLLFSGNKILVEKVHDFCTKLFNDGNRSIYLLSCLIDILNTN